eukprot:CAMPEP_0119123334 /NCGR_PEP_ID=MMETSP1310-20130426/3309_1 /TAXON_ID=464262 /ORGANISM="Genus nov. species nov., Strain RCC2339" /LENGTH=462 /DNA_ID=CAMNT_0007113125 /DNA_START=36 /DNA_END=1424 /DNA_ORIENTATION=+
MSDDDGFGFDDGDGGDEFEFEYYDEEDGGEGFEEEETLESMIHNNYLEAKSKYRDDGAKADALVQLETVMDLDENMDVTERTRWSFKAPQMAALIHLELALGSEGEAKASHFKKCLSLYRKAMRALSKLGSYAPKEKNILPALEKLEAHPDYNELLELTTTTLQARKLAIYHTVRLKLLLRDARHMLDAGEVQKCSANLRECRRISSAEEKPYIFQEVIALEVRVASADNNEREIRNLYHEFDRMSVLPAPEVNAIVREAGGKIHMRERRWGLAYKDFFEAFKSYSDRADARAVRCLKYLVVAKLLMSGPAIDPFAESSAKAHEEKPDIVVMRDILKADRGADIQMFDKIVHDSGHVLASDTFLAGFVATIRASIRTKALLRTVKPYRNVSLEYLAKHLNMEEREVRTMLVLLISDGILEGSIEDDTGVLQLHWDDTDQCAHKKAVRQYSQRLHNVVSNVSV